MFHCVILTFLYHHYCEMIITSNAFVPGCQMGGVRAPGLCRRAVCAGKRRISTMELLDQLPKCLHPELIQASESGECHDDSCRKTRHSVSRAKASVYLCRTVPIISSTCMQTQALRVKRWKLLTMMSPVCGLMVSRTVWAVLKLSMERKMQTYLSRIVFLLFMQF